MDSTPAGLCASCVHQRIVRSGRGSQFSMCLRHRDDPAYPKYPRLPVTACAGHVRRPRRGAGPTTTSAT